MKSNNYEVNNREVCLQLSIERCQNHLSHLHALMHLCEPYDLGLDEVTSRNAQLIMTALSNELAAVSEALIEHEESTQSSDEADAA